jgi:signal transduction histidine kinase
MSEDPTPPLSRDSHQALALSIARAVQLGLPAEDSEEAIRASVREALLAEARRNELLLGYFRCALVATMIAATFVAYLRPPWVGQDGLSWPAALVLAGWLAAAIALAVLLARGWYRHWVRKAVPVADAVSITAGFLFVSLNFSQLGLPSPPGAYLAAGVACSFLAFSGALRLSRSAATLATVLAVLSWLAVWAIGGVASLAALVTAGLILATGLLATRITRVIRRVIVDEVTRHRLIQLYQKAQEAIDAREEVLKIVSHDLRNPLSTIAMATDMLLHEPASEEQRTRRLGIIKRQGERMRSLIGDLLDAARIESGRLPIEPELVKVDELVENVIEMMQPLAADRGITLEVAVSPDLPSVRVDPERIHQVFSNLVGNAIKFTPERGRISLAAAQIGDKLRLSVSDTGPGIPQEQLQEIFGRMWQARKGDTRGIGLGLTIARAIVEAHGERIGVESRVGAGTEFWFTVPVAAAAQPAEHVSAELLSS